MSAEQLLDVSPAFLEAVGVANRVAEQQPERFAMILDRVLERLSSGDAPFSEVEEAQLAQVLGIQDAATVHKVIDALGGSFRRVAAKGGNVQSFGEALVASGGCEQLVMAMQSAWHAQGPKVLKQLKQIPFGAPKCLESLTWQVHVPLAGSDTAPGSGPADELGGTIEFNLAPLLGTVGKEVETRDGKESFAVDFTKEELFKFFGDIEKIQSQLDNLV